MKKGQVDELDKQLPMRGLGKAMPADLVTLARPILAAYNRPSDIAHWPIPTAVASGLDLVE